MRIEITPLQRDVHAWVSSWPISDRAAAFAKGLPLIRLYMLGHPPGGVVTMPQFGERLNDFGRGVFEFCRRVNTFEPLTDLQTEGLQRLLERQDARGLTVASLQFLMFSWMLDGSGAGIERFRAQGWYDWPDDFSRDSADLAESHYLLAMGTLGHRGGLEVDLLLDAFKAVCQKELDALEGLPRSIDAVYTAIRGAQRIAHAASKLEDDYKKLMGVSATRPRGINLRPSEDGLSDWDRDCLNYWYRNVHRLSNKKIQSCLYRDRDSNYPKERRKEVRRFLRESSGLVDWSKASALNVAGAARIKMTRHPTGQIRNEDL